MKSNTPLARRNTKRTPCHIKRRAITGSNKKRSKTAMPDITVSASSTEYTLSRGCRRKMDTKVMSTIIPAFRFTLRSLQIVWALKFLTTMAICAVGFLTGFILVAIGNLHYCHF
jgi:hypothetical protein